MTIDDGVSVEPLEFSGGRGTVEGQPTKGVEPPMLTLTTDAQKAVAVLSRSTVASHSPGLRICRRPDRPTFSVKRAVVPEETDLVVERDGARVYLGPIAALRFRDGVLDVRRDDLGRLQFVARRSA